MKNIIILSFILLFVSQIQAHDGETITLTTPRLRVGIEAGAAVLFGNINKPEMIRENRSYYHDPEDRDYDYNCGFVSEQQSYGLFYVGLKPEYVLSKRFAVAVGVRFSFYKAVLSSDKEAFLWRISEDERNTNYVKIKNISQKNYLVGVPLEIRFFPNEKDYFVRHYFIWGTTLNFLVTSTTEVEFQNGRMEKYSSDVTDQIGKPNNFLGLFYGGVGLKIGKTNYPFGNIEIHFPVIAYGNNQSKSFAKIENEFGLGIRATLQLPIFAKHQLTYTVTD